MLWELTIDSLFGFHFARSPLYVHIITKCGTPKDILILQKNMQIFVTCVVDYPFVGEIHQI